jgi:hypothetical protein
VQAAHRGERLYMPTRKLPEYYDVPHRHWKAAPSEIAALLDAYQAASAAASRTATDLDALAVTMNAPSRILAAARAITAAQPGTPGAPDGQPGARGSSPTTTPTP